MGRKFRLHLWCDRCQWFGHDAEHCAVEVVCAHCHGRHAGILCPTDQRQRSRTFAEGPLPLDNLPRGIQIAADDPKQQKRKKINASRRAQRNRAPTTKTLLANQRAQSRTRPHRMADYRMVCHQMSKVGYIVGIPASTSSTYSVQGYAADATATTVGERKGLLLSNSSLFLAGLRLRVRRCCSFCSAGLGFSLQHEVSPGRP
ncbi:hypothetical protein XA68_13950 [Ophiocordyceps unilateralis]|uniref:Uncharacterized protein n=1 Tax=Ophiocordyceps unilateralis TaxID=268505 RepID=A0A2A9PNH1_OPHUN|nr:hypothetical protein XA68_13950 [Ophiocordyceps unilateralis]